MRIAALLTLLALPVSAYTPEQLLEGRDNVFNCPEGEDVCTISRKDAEWVVQRDAFMQRLMEVAGKQLKNCGVKGI